MPQEPPSYPPQPGHPPQPGYPPQPGWAPPSAGPAWSAPAPAEGTRPPRIATGPAIASLVLCAFVALFYVVRVVQSGITYSAQLDASGQDTPDTWAWHVPASLTQSGFAVVAVVLALVAVLQPRGRRPLPVVALVVAATVLGLSLDDSIFTVLYAVLRG